MQSYRAVAQKLSLPHTFQVWNQIAHKSVNFAARKNLLLLGLNSLPFYIYIRLAQKYVHSSQTKDFTLGTTFSHCLGQKQYKKVKIKFFHWFFHPAQAIQSFTTCEIEVTRKFNFFQNFYKRLSQTVDKNFIFLFSVMLLTQRIRKSCPQSEIFSLGGQYYGLGQSTLYVHCQLYQLGSSINPTVFYVSEIWK